MARSLVWLGLALVGACAPGAPARKGQRGAPIPVAVTPPAPAPTATATPAARPWKVGVLLPFSGPEAPFAAHTREGIQVAVDAANARGGPAGRRIDLVYSDDASNVQLAAERTGQISTGVAGTQKHCWVRVRGLAPFNLRGRTTAPAPWPSRRARRAP